MSSRERAPATIIMQPQTSGYLQTATFSISNSDTSPPPPRETTLLVLGYNSIAYKYNQKAIEKQYKFPRIPRAVDIASSIDPTATNHNEDDDGCMNSIAPSPHIVFLQFKVQISSCPHPPDLIHAVVYLLASTGKACCPQIT